MVHLSVIVYSFIIPLTWAIINTALPKPRFCWLSQAYLLLLVFVFELPGGRAKASMPLGLANSS
jgi:hypothetical protein